MILRLGLIVLTLGISACNNSKFPTPHEVEHQISLDKEEKNKESQREMEARRQFSLDQFRSFVVFRLKDVVEKKECQYVTGPISDPILKTNTVPGENDYKQIVFDLNKSGYIASFKNRPMLWWMSKEMVIEKCQKVYDQAIKDKKELTEDLFKSKKAEDCIAQEYTVENCPGKIS